MAQEAIADDGPLAGNVNLTVEEVDGEWPDSTIWTTGPGERHKYNLKHPPGDRSLSSTGAIPNYVYVRTLGADDQ